MMRLAPNVFVASFGDRSVVLHLDRDRYIGLGAEMTDAMSKLLDTTQARTGRYDLDLAPAQSKLMSQGILVHGVHDVRPLVVQPPDHDRWPSEQVLSNTDQGRRRSAPTLLALTQTHLALHFAPFDGTIAWMRREKRRATRRAFQGDRNVQGALDDFFVARPWFPIRPICRLDALALSLVMWRRGADAQLVFGVRLEPFGAHCWLQHEGAVLNEPIEGVLPFTPIMAV